MEEESDNELDELQEYTINFLALQEMALMQ
jgi:hypothetical protein